MLREAVLLAKNDGKRCKKCLLNGMFQVSFILLSRKVKQELGNIITIFVVCI